MGRSWKLPVGTDAEGGDGVRAVAWWQERLRLVVAVEDDDDAGRDVDDFILVDELQRARARCQQTQRASAHFRRHILLLSRSNWIIEEILISRINLN